MLTNVVTNEPYCKVLPFCFLVNIGVFPFLWGFLL